MLYCNLQYYFQRNTLFLKPKITKSKNKKYIKTFFNVVSAACRSEVFFTCSDIISKTTCIFHLFQVTRSSYLSNSRSISSIPTQNSCCYSKPGPGQCNTRVAEISQSCSKFGAAIRRTYSEKLVLCQAGFRSMH